MRTNNLPIRTGDGVRAVTDIQLDLPDGTKQHWPTGYLLSVRETLAGKRFIVFRGSLRENVPGYAANVGIDEIEQAYQIVNGTYYSARTSANIIGILEHCRKFGATVRVFNGDRDTGRYWGDDEMNEAGRIGHSTGKYKIPLLVSKGDDGGPGLLDDCIVKIVQTGKIERVLFQHPNFHTTGV